ncbi:MAG TPA: hypothetical protein PKA82_12805 [Pyrinomonadaceae bacterium]|nr:hypothetical protein [Pyrinomonadaceae bacterium]
MKKIVLTSLLALFLAFPVLPQDGPETVELPDAVMEQVVRQIVGRYFKQRATPKEINISAQGIKAEWLPNVKNIKFVVVPDKKVALVSYMYAFEPVERKGKHYSVVFGLGNPTCDRNGDIWHFRVVKGRVHLIRRFGVMIIRCDND